MFTLLHCIFTLICYNVVMFAVEAIESGTHGYLHWAMLS